jgi:hypothetical protein
MKDTLRDLDLRYPDFTLRSYRQLIEALSCRWQIIRLSEAFAEPLRPNCLILRHDIDISPTLALPMAEIEDAVGIRSTYFVALHLSYNVHQPKNANAIRTMAEMGHEIGFHYDGLLYPGEKASLEENLALLDRHVEILTQICSMPVVSIARHNPSIAKESDPFKAAVKYNNAYDGRLFQNTLYISDSCGAWRAGGLSPCWHEPRPKRLYLLIHAEQWAETTNQDRMARFEIMRERAMSEHDTFFREVGCVWRNHPGGKEHDERLRLQKKGYD